MSTNRFRRWLRGFGGVVMAMLALGVQAAFGADPGPVPVLDRVVSVDEATGTYSKVPATGPVAKLEERLRQKNASLAFEEDHGYLLDVLRQLDVPISSQVLVFTKTSLQRPDISPRNPRAIFFSDDVYVAWVPGADLLEVSSSDPLLGAVWYTVDQQKSDSPGFERNDQCLECHVTSKTMGVPGHLARSNVPDETGHVGLLESSVVMDDRWPLAKRWGGWYVTGTHGTQSHLGNLFGKEALEKHEADPSFGGNLTNLSRFFPVETYPAGSSDIVALMVLNHQIGMQNWITLLHYEANLHLARYGHIRYLKEMSREFLKHMLFVEEAALTSPVQGTSKFAEEFTARGPRDAKGRSLRQFDLESRLFRYPCSYLIYSDRFEALPDPVKKHLYHQLWDILSGRDEGTDFESITPANRVAIKEILIQTKSELPVYWTL